MSMSVHEKTNVGGFSQAALLKRTTALSALAFALPCLLAACVTINIYFPAAAAEKMADRIIDEVWQPQKTAPQAQPAADAAADTSTSAEVQ